VGIESVVLSGLSADTPIWCHAHVRDATGRKEDTLVGDFEICDEAGRSLGRITGLLLQKVRRESWLRLTQAAVAPSIYQVEWREQVCGESGPPGQGDWLVFADRVGLGEELARRLGESASRARLVFPEEVENSEAGYARLIGEVSGLQGVVYLWPLDAETPDLKEELTRLTRGALYLLKALAGKRLVEGFGVWLVTRGTQGVSASRAPLDLRGAALSGLAKSAMLEHPELRCVCVDLEAGVVVEESAKLLAEISQVNREDRVTLRGERRYVARLARSPLEQAGNVKAGVVSAVRLEIPQRGVLDNLVLVPLQRRAPQAGEVEIEVKATGLNFRDVLNALGMYPGDAGLLGAECAGTIVAVGAGVTGLKPGQQVMAIAAGSFSSYVIVPAISVWANPGHLSFAQMATIPITFLTAQYGLRRLAGIKAGDRVLIHAAAGGVGLAAVQLAQGAGAEIFATASLPKWETLKAMGVSHIMNSRSLQFAEQVMEATGGQGVDIVLNSLAGEFIPKSLGVLGTGGRFLEIGKREIWTAAHMAEARPDVAYFAYDLAELLQSQPQELQALLGDLLREFGEGKLQALPHTDFPIESAATAFRHMGQGKHIGKVVVTQGTAVQRRSTAVVRADRSYLISGGLGALGLKVARWLIEQGARHVLLVGRKAPTPEVREQLAALAGSNGNAVRVKSVQADVQSFEQTARLFEEELADMPELGGVIHAAGVLEDSLLLQLDWERFERALGPKVWGAWNLHQLCRERPVDFFVLFSSVASVLGSPGQANYAAGNAFLDALAQHRQGLGLPAMSVNWGPWEEAGMAARTEEGRRDVWAARGLHTIGSQPGLALLGRLLQAGQTQPLVAAVDWPRFLSLLPGAGGAALFEAMRSGSGPASPPAAAGRRRREQLLQELRKAPGRKRKSILVARVSEELRAVLGLQPAEPIDPRQGLSTLGMDSLMAVELRSRLQEAFGCALPATLAFEHPTVEAVAEFLSEELNLEPGAEPPAAQAVAPPASVEIADPEQLDELSETELERLLEGRLAAMQSPATGVSGGDPRPSDPTQTAKSH
jgi:NADPH:quinone reductase-like Zn-dependent oxidoreductase/acyl carrier protein